MKLHLKKPLSRKLFAIKSMKNITGLGLKEAKDIIDSLSESYIHKYKHIIIDVDITNNDRKEIDILEEEGVVFGDGDNREDTIDELLIKYIVEIPSEQLVYKVFEGDYNIESNILTLNIISGKLKKPTGEFYYPDRELSNIKITMDFSKSLIEEKI